MSTRQTAVTQAITTITKNGTIPQPDLLALLYGVATELSYTAVLQHTAVAAERFLNAPSYQQRARRAELRTAVMQARARGLLP